jgi:hypothetical protein
MHRFKYVACVLALAATACGNDSSIINPSNPSLLTIDYTDAINGPLTPNGSQTFQFATLTAGTVSVQLMTLNPDGPNGATIGLELGVYGNTGSCQRTVHNDNLGIGGVAVIATATTAGNLCASIYDANGKLPGPQSFDIQVMHP